jgi:hypothetical protein
MKVMYNLSMNSCIILTNSSPTTHRQTPTLVLTSVEASQTTFRLQHLLGRAEEDEESRRTQAPAAIDPKEVVV